MKTTVLDTASVLRMKESLLSLMVTKPVDKIRVNELVKTAGVSRATFYLYYDNLSMIYDEVVLDYLTPIEEICCQPSSKNNLEASLEQKLKAIITFIDNHKVTFNILFSNNNSYFYYRIKHLFSLLLAKEFGESQPKYAYSLTSGALIELIKTWLEDDQDFKSEKIFDFIEGSVSHIYVLFSISNAS